MSYSITTKDGITLQNIPDDVPADSPVLKQRVADIRMKWEAANAPTDRQALLASAPMRLAKGGKDPMDGGAQLLRRAVNFAGELVSPTARLQAKLGGPRPADYVDRAADAVGGEGTFLGDVVGIKGASDEQLRQDIKASDAEYEAARKATGQTGIDALRIAGNVLSPVNAGVARVVPVSRITGTKKAIAARGAVAGAAGAATQPVMGEDFASEKAGQVVLGAAAGGALAPVIAKAGQAVGRMVDAWRRRPDSINVNPETVRMQVRAALQADGIDVATLPDVVFNRLADDATAALKTGRVLDPAAALRAQDFQATGIPFTKGQVTRDPGQWQKEFNIAGIEGAGEPVRNVFTAQSRGVSNVFQRGSRNAGESFDDAGILLRDLKAANETAEQNVRSAYKAFRESTGRELQVPLQGLAQDYAATLRDYGQTIPGAVRSQFEDLGLLTGKQLKSLSIDDAERLIKVINKNFNPADRAQAGALGELRASLQRAIVGAADTADDGLGAEAAALAKEARGTAASRFRAIDETPALKAAINNAEPDDFIKKYVVGGKVNEIDRMMDLLSGEGREKVRAQTVKYLEQQAFGANAAGDGKAAQATFNNALNRIGRNKLVALLGADGADEMQRIGRVLAYIKQAPEGATPNTSGTSQALLSALGKARGLAGLPYINDFVVKPLQGFADRRAASDALHQALTSRADLDPATVRTLSRLLAPVPVAGGVAAGESIR